MAVVVVPAYFQEAKNHEINMKVKCEKIFVIGDSISCYYGEYLEPMLAGLLEYDRKGGTNKLVDLDDCTDGINGGDSSMVLAYLKSVVEMEFFQPDYLMLNCGIHDTKTSENGLQVPLVQYQSNLEAILDIAKTHGIKVIWVRTTPVNQHTPHWSSDEIAKRKGYIEQYNQVADEIMDSHNIPIIDLYQFTLNLGDDIFMNKDDTVHFNDTAAKLQASFIAGALVQLSKVVLNV